MAIKFRPVRVLMLLTYQNVCNYNFCIYRNQILTIQMAESSKRGLSPKISSENIKPIFTSDAIGLDIIAYL